MRDSLPCVLRSPAVLLAGVLLTGTGVAGTSGCARARPPARPLPAWVFETSRSGKMAAPLPAKARPRGGVQGRSEASDFVVAALQQSGLRFGTDGSVEALWGYLKSSHAPLAPTASRPGDVLFFQTRVATPVESAGAQAPAPTCQAPDHVGIVARVDAGGRINFVEARDGHVQRSYANPERPQVRRDESGRVLNSFLRPKRPEDPPDSPNFAGEMLCAAVRPR